MFSSFETECPTLVIASLSTWTRIIALQESDQVVEDPTKGASYTTLNFYMCFSALFYSFVVVGMDGAEPRRTQ